MNPLATGGRTVPPEWIDYIGHMMDAYYFIAFTEATETFLDHLGLGEGYRAYSGCGMYTVESHLCFSKSVRAVVATNELMFLHVDIASERVTPMPPERWRAASRLAAAHGTLATPADAGKRIQLRRS